jgi:hypothetical protein
LFRFCAFPIVLVVVVVLVLGCFPVVPAKLPPLASLSSFFSSTLALRFGLRSAIENEDEDEGEDDLRERRG